MLADRATNWRLCACFHSGNGFQLRTKHLALAEAGGPVLTAVGAQPVGAQPVLSGGSNGNIASNSPTFPRAPRLYREALLRPSA